MKMDFTLKVTRLSLAGGHSCGYECLDPGLKGEELPSPVF